MREITGIDAEDTLNAVVARHPAMLAVLTRRGLDTCCGGALSLREAAHHHNLNVADLLCELNAATGAASCRRAAHT